MVDSWSSSPKCPPSLDGQPLTVRLEQGHSQHVAAPWGIACYGEGETNGAPVELN